MPADSVIDPPVVFPPVAVVTVIVPCRVVVMFAPMAAARTASRGVHVIVTAELVALVV